MNNNAVQNKNTISGVHCSSMSFEHIFPAILKTVHSDKSNSNRKRYRFNRPQPGIVITTLIS